MKFFWILTLCFCLGNGAVVSSAFSKPKLTSHSSESSAEKRWLTLAAGEDKVVDLKFEANTQDRGIMVGNPKVVNHKVIRVGNQDQIVFRPLSAGSTTVQVRDQYGNLKVIFHLRVTESNLLRIAGEIRNLLRDVEGIDIRCVGKKVVIDGEVLVPNDYGKVMTVVKDNVYSSYIINMAVLSPLGIQILAKRIEKDIQVFAPNVRTRVVNSTIFLEGSVEAAGLKKRAVDLAQVYLPEVKPVSILERSEDQLQRLPPGRNQIIDFIVVNEPPPKRDEKLVRVTVHFVELAKDYNRVFGFKWNPGFKTDPQITLGDTETGTEATAGTSFTATITSLFPTLQSAQNAGYARILKSGTVIVRNKEEASIRKVTDIQVPVTSAQGVTSFSPVSAGTEVKVTPEILAPSEDIGLALNVEQSAVVGRTPAQGSSAPQISKNVIQTKLFVKSTESAAIGGLTSSDTGTDFNKDDPSSGSSNGANKDLFNITRSKAYRKAKGQFVVFVTPEIISSASTGTQDLKRNFRVKVK